MIAAFVVPEKKREYIDREAAMAYAPLPKELRKYQTFNLDDAWEDGYDFAISQISAIPAADVRPVKRGRWERENENSLYCCSICGKVAPYDVEADTIMYWPNLNYCPNCGCAMEGTE